MKKRIRIAGIYCAILWIAFFLALFMDIEGVWTTLFSAFLMLQATILMYQKKVSGYVGAILVSIFMLFYSSYQLYHVGYEIFHLTSVTVSGMALLALLISTEV